MDFKLTSDFKPTGDQPEAIVKLAEGLEKDVREQVLLGVTGSGKTYTMANVISQEQRPVLVISHNKTLAAQLYQEFKSFFPKNAVSYFVSYYDYYQPEAYVPQTDTYIEKETEINEEIDKLRLAATTNILTRKDTIVVASVSCIYNIGSPKEYGSFILELKPGVAIRRESILSRLVQLQYDRSDFGFHRSTFRVRGNFIDVFPAYEDYGLRIEFSETKIVQLTTIDPLTGKEIDEREEFVLFPAKHYMTDPKSHKKTFSKIELDLNNQVKLFKDQGKFIESQRISERVKFDLEMISEMGYVNGIENYSRYFDGRNPGDPPYTLLDYYKEKYQDGWLLFIDESHMTLPQIRGMYLGDRSRKQTLVDFGFRLPAALDNRPLKFDEFLRRTPQTIYVSATPSAWEISRAQESAHRKSITHSGVVEQLIRPTGLLDPEIEVRPTSGQIDDLTAEIESRVRKKERVLVTTLTKRMAEDLSEYLAERRIQVHHLHSDVHTLTRTDILDKLRRGEYDVLVGINLLREGLDLPEVSLVAILDADKEGFLRSEVSLIQTMGRAARHVNARVIMYADSVTGSMQRAINEVDRRRKVQLKYNYDHNIVPQTIQKPLRTSMMAQDLQDVPLWKKVGKHAGQAQFLDINDEALTPLDRNRLISRLQKEMKQFAQELNFEMAAQIRDKIRDLENVTD